MTDELVKRHVEQLRMTGGDLADLCRPLADAIEALTAERDVAWAYMSALQGDLYDAIMIKAERDRLRALLAKADRRIVWEANGFGSDFADQVQAALKGEMP